MICCSRTIASRRCPKTPSRASPSSSFCVLLWNEKKAETLTYLIFLTVTWREWNLLYSQGSLRGLHSTWGSQLGKQCFSRAAQIGAEALLHLKTFNNPKLREFPRPDTFPRIQTLILSYAYHCCAFLPLVAMSAKRKTSQVQEAVLFPSDAEFDMTLWNNSMMNIWPQMRECPNKKFLLYLFSVITIRPY